MRMLYLLAVPSLALICAAPTVGAQAIAEKALTTAATPAPTLRIPNVNLPRTTTSGGAVHHYTPRNANLHAAPQRSTTRSMHKSSHSAHTHITYRRIQ